MRPAFLHVARTLGALATLLVGRGAEAVGDEEWQAAVHVGLAAVAADDRRPLGCDLGLDGLYGIADGWAAHLTLDGSLHPVSAAGSRRAGTVQSGGLTGGVTYAIDILRLVPFVEAGLGYMHLGGAVTQPRDDLGFELGLGTEYLLTRHLTAALVARFRDFPLRLHQLNGAFDTTPSLFSVDLRIGWIF